MKRVLGIGVVGSIVAVVAAVFASGALTVDVGTSGTAASADSERNEERVRPTMVAVAIGQVEEEPHVADGHEHEYSTVDLRASIRNGKAGGALRFFCEEAGYYNGAVRTLEAVDGVIHVTGGGVLFRPDGTRIGVQYVAEFDSNANTATVSVTGHDYEYTMTGELDGLITVWTPPND